MFFTECFRGINRYVLIFTNVIKNGIIIELECSINHQSDTGIEIYEMQNTYLDYPSEKVKQRQ